MLRSLIDWHEPCDSITLSPDETEETEMEETLARMRPAMPAEVIIPVCAGVGAAAVAGSTVAAASNKSADPWYRRILDWGSGILVAAWVGPSICALWNLTEEHHRAAVIFATGLSGTILTKTFLDLMNSNTFRRWLVAKAMGTIAIGPMGPPGVTGAAAAAGATGAVGSQGAPGTGV